MRKVFSLIINKIKYYFKPTININTDLLIFDDIFPHPFSDWRMNEYLHYLNNIERTLIVTDISKQNIFKSRKHHFELFYKDNEHFKDKIIFYEDKLKIKAKLVYCMFYNNLIKIFKHIEQNKIPFFFTLYPGGGFNIYDDRVDKNLKMIFSSQYFKHVYVNMPFVYHYIIEKYQLEESKISLKYGAPLELSNFNFDKIEDSKIRVVFCAHKYSKFGLDKGFDIFNRVAKKLENNNNFEFTCIGNFNKNDLVVSTENINFIEELLPENLFNIFGSQDVILSPNRSHILGYGAFDGFPTGAVLHACFCNCLMMITDDWNNAEYLNLKNGEDFILVPTNEAYIVEKLLYFLKNKDELKIIAKRAKLKLIDNLDLQNQLTNKFNIISKLLNDSSHQNFFTTHPRVLSTSTTCL